MNTTSLFTFLNELEANNSKDWFDEHRDEYKALRAEFVEYFKSLVQKLQVFDPTLNEVTPKNAIFRINRDVRFSKDKSPYKPYFSAVMAMHGGKKSPYAWWYIHFQPGNRTVCGTWLYMPSKEVTAAMRAKLVVSWKKFKTIVQDRSFVDQFGLLQWRSLKRAPKWYESDAERIQYIRMKDWYVMREFEDKEVATLDTFTQQAILCYKTALPFRDFCNSAVQESLEIQADTSRK